MISLVTVNFNSYDWLDILIESLSIYSTLPYELIVVDFSDEKRILNIPNVRHFRLPENRGHGEGLNYACKNTRFATDHYDYVMFLDIDCHILQKGWEEAFLGLMKDYDVVGGKGVPEKPIRPACMFMKRNIAFINNWSATPGYMGHRVTPDGYDTAIKAYHEMIRDKVPMKLLESCPNRYGTLNGEEWMVDGTPYVYHHWHGSHLKERQIDFPNDDLLADKKKLFDSVPWRHV